MSGSAGFTVAFTCLYAVFLLGVAHALDRLARRAAARSRAWHSGGFTYHAGHDAWRCPQDQWLWPHSFDPEHRVVRYRASPVVCNACPVKSTCTSTERGREVSRGVDPWPASEAERFHRGIACVVALLAVAWPLVSALTVDAPWASPALVGIGVAVGLGGWPLWSHLRRSPAGFPEHLRTRTLDEGADLDALTAQRESRRRTTYRSDRRGGTGPPSGTSPGFAERWAALERDDAATHEAGWSRRGPR